MIYCACCQQPNNHGFSDREIDDMRRELAKQWNQSISQVTEYEALSYLRAAAGKSGSRDGV